MPQHNFSHTRRDFIKKVSVGTTALSLGSFINACSRTNPEPRSFLDSEIDVELQLSAVEDTIQILPGKRTRVLRYRGELVAGPADTIETLANSYLGPILHFQKGQKVRIHFQNQISEPSIIHWHGLHVPETADGHPRLVIDAGETYQYDFEVMDRAGTYWYHPHPHGRTGPQVYQGLAGLIIVHDELESALALPRDAFDLPIVIQDRTFDVNNQLFYGGSHMNQMMGFLGETLLINGQTLQPIAVENRSYRLRILNGSNSRIYKLAWSDGKKLTIIGTDGGLLEKPLDKEFATLAPGQRVEIWVDFSSRALGETLQLVNKANDTPGGKNEFTVATFTVEKSAVDTTALPAQLTPLTLHLPEDAVNTNNPREFALRLGRGMVWNINGRTFAMDEVAPEEQVKLGDLEIWKFTNPSESGIGMILPHPMHVHGLQFQIINRHINPRLDSIWGSVSEGYVDEGWHDTVLVMPGEEVEVLMRFEDFKGLYLYHCHNLEHEDMGMMRNYRVSA